MLAIYTKLASVNVPYSNRLLAASIFMLLPQQTCKTLSLPVGNERNLVGGERHVDTFALSPYTF